MPSTPSPTMELLGRIAYELHQMKPLFPTYVHLLVSAIFPIYTAAHAALARPSSAAPLQKKKDVNVNELQDEEISPTIESLTPSDAILFPVLAGVTLASLYFILKWLQDPALLNYYLGLYFAIVGLFFAVKFVKDGLATARSILLPNQYSYRGKLWKLTSGERHFTAADTSQHTSTRSSPLPGIFSIFFQRYNSIIWSFRMFVYTKLRLAFGIRRIINITTFIDTLDLTSIFITVPLVYYHTFVDKPWFLTNFLGFSFCYGSLQITTPGTTWTGTLLLCALFFYDIYFVFFTPMMVTVATKLDVPIKLLFPRPDGCTRPMGTAKDSEVWQEYLQCLAKRRTMAMLGLGDIVIPGMMLAFALRFDLYLYYRKLANKSTAVTDSDGKEEVVKKKTPYLPVTGSWGERFWTSTKMYTPDLQAKQFPKTYFTASIVGYVLGMIVTVVVMQVAKHAQPALLYLVPGVLLSLWGVALVRGDFRALWEYSEVPADEEKTTDQKDKDKKKDEEKHRRHEGSKSSEENADDEIETTEAGESTKENSHAVRDDRTSNENDTNPASKTTSNQSNKDRSESETEPENTTELIHFSLSVVHPPKPQSPQSQTPEPLTPPPPASPVTKNIGAHSTSTDEFSVSSADEENDDPEEGRRKTTRKTTKPSADDNTTSARRVTRASRSASAIKAADGGNARTDGSEPVVKRRRKA